MTAPFAAVGDGLPGSGVPVPRRGGSVGRAPAGGSDDWETPEWLLERARALFGGPIGLDPFSALDNPTKATKFLCPQNGQDGLKDPWTITGGCSIWVNHPYGKMLKPCTGVVMAWYPCVVFNGGQMLDLVPARPSSPWWQALAQGCQAMLEFGGPSPLLRGGRIAFVDPKTKLPVPGSNTPSTLFYFGDHRDDFALHFHDLGTVFRRSW